MTLFLPNNGLYWKWALLFPNRWSNSQFWYICHGGKLEHRETKLKPLFSKVRDNDVQRTGERITWPEATQPWRSRQILSICVPTVYQSPGTLNLLNEQTWRHVCHKAKGAQQCLCLSSIQGGKYLQRLFKPPFYNNFCRCLSVFQICHQNNPYSNRWVSLKLVLSLHWGDAVYVSVSMCVRAWVCKGSPYNTSNGTWYQDRRCSLRSSVTSIYLPDGWGS